MEIAQLKRFTYSAYLSLYCAYKLWQEVDLSRQKWTINEAFIFFEIVPLAFKSLISREFFIGRNTSEFLFDIVWSRNVFLLMSSSSSILLLRRIFSSGKKKKSEFHKKKADQKVTRLLIKKYWLKNNWLNATFFLMYLCTDRTNILILKITTWKSSIEELMKNKVFGLVWFYGIPIIVSYLMPDSLYAHIWNKWFVNISQQN